MSKYKIFTGALLFSISSFIAVYSAIKNHITHANFFVIVEGAKATLTSISPQGDAINIKPEKNTNNYFFWGGNKNELRNIAYFIIKTDVSKLEKVSIYQEKDKLLVTYNKDEFIDKWKETKYGYRVPSDIVIKRSLLPKINQVINWKGDIYMLPVFVMIYFITALVVYLSYYLFEKNSQFLIIVKHLKNYIIVHKVSLKNEFTFSYILITLAFIGIAFLNQPFSDDFYRTPNYNNGWLQDGRYLMHFAYQLITVNLNRPIAIATPYTYFISTAFLALVSLILARYFNRKNIYISIIIASFVSLLPFFYANILYQHERLMMSFSMLWAISLSLFTWHINAKTSFVFSFLGLSALFLLYQPMLAYYIFMIAFIFCLALINNKNNLKSAFTSSFIALASFSFAMLFYKTTNNFLAGMDKIEYASTVSNFNINIDLLSRLKELSNTLYNQWQNSFFGYISVLILIIFIIIFIKNFIKSIPNSLAIIPFSISFLAIFISPSLIYLLSNLSLAYRYISSINLLIAMALLFIYNYSKNNYLHKFSIAITILLLMSSLSMISYLNNTLQNVAKYHLELKIHLKEDLYQLEKRGLNPNTFGLVNHLNIIKTLDSPEKERYLPAIQYILTKHNTEFSIPNSMGFTKWTNFHKYQHSELINLPYEEIIDRRYYSIIYYPSLKKTIISFK